MIKSERKIFLPSSTRQWMDGWRDCIHHGARILCNSCKLGVSRGSLGKVTELLRHVEIILWMWHPHYRIYTLSHLRVIMTSCDMFIHSLKKETKIYQHLAKICNLPERNNGERSIALVRHLVSHWHSPIIIQPKVPPTLGRMWSYIRISNNAHNIIMNKISIQTIPIHSYWKHRYYHESKHNFLFLLGPNVYRGVCPPGTFSGWRHHHHFLILAGTRVVTFSVTIRITLHRGTVIVSTTVVVMVVNVGSTSGHVAIRSGWGCSTVPSSSRGWTEEEE